VVFSKYLALRGQNPAMPPDVPGPQNNFNASPEGSPEEPPELLEIRRFLKDVQQRFNELEFERAERRRIGGELRSLEARLEENLDRISALEEGMEQSLSALAALPEPPSRGDFAELRKEVSAIDIEAIGRRIERVEQGLATCIDALARLADPGVHEQLTRLDARLTSVEAAAANSAQVKAEPPPDSVLKELGELKAALQNVTLRYSEIGELKKNHLVLRDMLESLEQSTASLRKEALSFNTAKAADLEKEVLALRAELRQWCGRIDGLEARLPDSEEESETAAHKEIALLREEFLQGQTQLQILQKQFESLVEPRTQAAGASSQGEMSGIRENLDEIRRFMSTLSHKL
jgi:chromosome segregation ATPase